MHSLKTARPLLTSVAYFVVFAMVLFSIIGVQSFKGSMRRTCVIVEGHHLRDGQFCGGHIDPVTLNVTGYIDLNNNTVPDSKGYICPLGQRCMVNSKSCCEFFASNSPFHCRNSVTLKITWKASMRFTTPRCKLSLWPQPMVYVHPYDVIDGRV